MDYVIKRQVTGAYWNRDIGWRADLDKATVYPDLASANKAITGTGIYGEPARHDTELRRSRIRSRR